MGFIPTKNPTSNEEMGPKLNPRTGFNKMIVKTRSINIVKYISETGNPLRYNLFACAGPLALCPILSNGLPLS